MTEQELNALKTAKGGWTRATLKQLGVEWPPPKGWKRKLLGKPAKKDRKTPKPKRTSLKAMKTEQWKRIVKRDGHKCSACGAAANVKDGVILQVRNMSDPFKARTGAASEDHLLNALCIACGEAYFRGGHAALEGHQDLIASRVPE